MSNINGEPMQTSTFKKRLAKAEENLTPKEWAIWLADMIRQYPSYSAFLEAAVMKDNLDNKPFEMMKKQLEAKHGGKKPEEIRAYNAAGRKMWTEYVFGRNLITNINNVIQARAEKAGLEAALKLQALQTIILQDSFGRTARKAAEWVELYKAADSDEEENRQVMLKELEEYFFDMDEKVEGLGGQKLRYFLDRIVGPAYLSQVEEWVFAAKSLIFDLYAHKGAVKVIQDEHFSGHPILAKDNEAGFESVIKTVEDAVKQHNEYLEVRARIFKAEWDEDEADGVPAWIGGEREGRLTINIDELKPAEGDMVKHLVNEWVKMARFESTVVNNRDMDLTYEDFWAMATKGSA